MGRRKSKGVHKDANNSAKCSAASLGGGTLSGWLTKQGGRRRTWKTRWFVLHGSVVYYFANEHSKRNIDTIVLTPESVIGHRVNNQNFEFSVSATRRTFVLRASTTYNKNQWITKLRDEISNLRDVNQVMHDAGNPRLVNMFATPDTHHSDTTHGEFVTNEDESISSVQFLIGSKRTMAHTEVEVIDPPDGALKDIPTHEQRRQQHPWFFNRFCCWCDPDFRCC